MRFGDTDPGKALAIRSVVERARCLPLFPTSPRQALLNDGQGVERAAGRPLGGAEREGREARAGRRGGPRRVLLAPRGGPTIAERRQISPRNGALHRRKRAAERILAMPTYHDINHELDQHRSKRD